jgi:hypothetical protein
MFRKVQDVLAGKRADRSKRQQFLYSRIVRCGVCGYSLIAERQKGHVYYRCHDRAFKKPCPPTCIREEALDAMVLTALEDIDLSDEELKLARGMIAEYRKELEQGQAAAREALSLQKDQIRLRLTKLTDLLLDGAIDKAAFGEKRDTLLLEELRVKERLAEIERDPASAAASLEKTVELAKSPSLLYKTALPEKKRELLKTLLSNLTVTGKNVALTLALPFCLIAEREKTPDGRPNRGTCRTWKQLLKQLFKGFRKQEVAAS